MIIGKAYIGYLHIPNLYRQEGQDILMFKEAWAMEKIHGTSANIQWAATSLYSTPELKFFSGGESHERFVALFNAEEIKSKLIDLGYGTRCVIIYGEAYGGKQQGMSHTYGPNLKFISFDVCSDGTNWLSVPEADAFCKSLDIEFVHYVKISTDLKEIDAQRDMYSIQAIRNGVSEYGPNSCVLNPKKREGVVLRPLIDLTKSNGTRIICKHKGDDFRETASPRVVNDPGKLQVLADADKIANEYVTVTRLEHVLDKIPEYGMEKCLSF